MTWEDVEQSTGSAEVQYKYPHVHIIPSKTHHTHVQDVEHTDAWMFAYTATSTLSIKRKNICTFPGIHTFQDYFPWAPNLAPLPAEGIPSQHKYTHTHTNVSADLLTTFLSKSVIDMLCDVHYVTWNYFQLIWDSIRMEFTNLRGDKCKRMRLL